MFIKTFQNKHGRIPQKIKISLHLSRMKKIVLLNSFSKSNFIHSLSLRSCYIKRAPRFDKYVDDVML